MATDSSEMRLILVDGHSLAHRAYFALFGAQRSFATAGGQPTGAVYGFLNMLLRMLEEYKPTHLAVVFDAPGPTFRHEQYEEYKAQRPEMASDLRPQLDLLREMLRVMRVAVYELPGFEADDLLGTIACRAADGGQEVLIFTGDRDALQLVSDRIKCLLTIKGVTDTREFDAAAVREAYGIEPVLMRDVKALMGDSSDNIPGIKGIGEKTALKLVRELGTLEQIYADLAKVSGANTRKLLAAGRETAFTSRELVTIKCDAPLVFTLADLARVEPDHERFAALLTELEFKTFLKRLYPTAPPAETSPPPPASSDTGAGRESALSAIKPAVEVREIKSSASLRDAVAWLSACETIALDVTVNGNRPSVATITGLTIAGRPRTGPADRTSLTGAGAAAPIAPRPAVARTYHIAITPAQEGLFGDANVATVAKAVPDADDSGDLHECDVLAAIGPLLADPDLVKVLHDAKNTLVILGRRQVSGCGVNAQGWVHVPGLVMDTAVAAYLIDPAASRYDLDRLAGEFLGWQTPPPSEESAAQASCRRALALLELRGRLEVELAGRGLADLWRRIELPLITVLAHIELTGVCLDLAALGQMDQEFSRRLAELTAEVYELAGMTFNLNSTRQLADVLYDKLGLPATKRTRKGKVASTDAETLEALADRHPIVPLILEHRQLHKLKGTYIDGLRALVDPHDGRIRTVFNQTVTTTGRLSSTEPNLQNIPIRDEMGRQIRRAFVASGPEHTLLTADYSQIELRILAHLSQDPVLIEAFELDQDIHRRTASEVFGVPLAEVTSDMRQAAKAVNFGIIYGISDYGLARNLGVGRAEASEYIAQYFARYGQVAGFFAETIAAAKRDGYVLTLLGRQRHLPDLHDQNFNIRAFGERTARNTPIQGSAADLIKLAMVALDEAIEARRWRARMVLQVHDELLFDVPLEELATLRELVVEYMQAAYKLRVPLKVDVGVGRNWYEAKDA